MRRLPLFIAVILGCAALAFLTGCPTKVTQPAAPAATKAPGPVAADAKAPATPENAANAKAGHVPESGKSNAKAEEAGPKDAKVFIRAFYPGNEKHQLIKKMIFAYATKYPGQVRARFVPFDSDEGFKEWQDAGLTCGTILVNDTQTFTVKKKGGKSEEVTLKMFVGGEWTQEDLDTIVADQVKLAYPGK